jgi:hypothetical protein
MSFDDLARNMRQRHGYADVDATQLVRRQDRGDRLVYMLGGLALVAGAAVLTWWSYGSSTGTYYVATGPLVLGVILFLRGALGK